MWWCLFQTARKVINVLANLQKTLDSQGRELMNAVERQITLSIIDDTWKEHLRAMDDLKQSVQTAYLEQKDPLVIYKMEAFELFRTMDNNMNKEIVSFLCHAAIPVEQQTPIREGHEQKTDMSRMKVRKDELVGAGSRIRTRSWKEVEIIMIHQNPLNRNPLKWVRK